MINYQICMFYYFVYKNWYKQQIISLSLPKKFQTDFKSSSILKLGFLNNYLGSNAISMQSAN